MTTPVVTEETGEPREDTSSGKALRRAKNERIAKELEEEQDLLAVLQTPQGRRTIWRLVASAQPYQEPFIAGQADTTAYQLGRQSWARRVLNFVHSTPELRKAWFATQEQAEEHGW